MMESMFERKEKLKKEKKSNFTQCCQKKKNFSQFYRSMGLFGDGFNYLGMFTALPHDRDLLRP